MTQEEIATLNLIVSAYLDFAELQARNRRPMAMRDWIVKLDEFLQLSERELLTHAGTVSHQGALVKAEAEYDRFRAIEASKPQPVDAHFEEAIDHMKHISAAKAKPKPKRAKREGPA